MPGTSPAWTISRKQTRHNPKRRYTERARPHRRQRVYARTLNFGFRCCFCTSAFFAISMRSLSASRDTRRAVVRSLASNLCSRSLASVAASLLFIPAEREAEGAQQGAALVVGGAGGDDGDVHPAHRIDLVVV